MRPKFHSVCAMAAMLLAAVFADVASAIPDLQFSDYKSFRQTARWKMDFQGGRFSVRVKDGFVTFAGCNGNGRPSITQPNPMGCPLGTTGFVASGDIDEDGLSDKNTFWSVRTVQSTQVLAPHLPGKLELSSSPPSALRRPFRGFRDYAQVIWYNVLQPPPGIFTIALYEVERLYGAGNGELNRQRREIVNGNYIFKIPVLPEVVGHKKPWPDESGVTELINPLPITVTHHPLVEAWPGRGIVPPTDDDWRLVYPSNWNDDEAVEVDPRLFTVFHWSGVNAHTVFPAVDRITFSIVDDFGLIIYPPYDPATPPGDRAPELLVTPTEGIEIGPYFYRPGQKGLAHLEINRSLATSKVARDVSSRIFEWRVHFVDSYQGWMEARIPATFPSGTPEEQTKPDVDFDGDGWSNLAEFALQTDPTNPGDSPVFRPYRDADTNQIILEVEKRPFVASAVSYRIQYSSDRTNWTTIEPGDPVYFIETDNGDLLKVRSRRPSPPETNGFLRVKITMAQ